MNIYVKEYVTSIKGKSFANDNDFQKLMWLEFVENLHGVLKLDLRKCKEVNIEIYKKNEMMDLKEIDLNSDLFKVVVMLDSYKKVIDFSGIDCVSKHLDETIKRLVQNEWRKLLIVAYNNDEEIKNILSQRKKEAIKQISADYESDINNLN